MRLLVGMVMVILAAGSVFADWFMGSFDTNGDGRVSMSEFPGDQDAFRVLDKNNDGFVDSSEAPTAPSTSEGSDVRAVVVAPGIIRWVPVRRPGMPLYGRPLKPYGQHGPYRPGGAVPRVKVPAAGARQVPPPAVRHGTPPGARYHLRPGTRPPSMGTRGSMPRHRSPRHR